MFIVKRRSEVIRFGLFLVLFGLMAYYVSGKVEVFKASRREGAAVPVGSHTAAVPGKKTPAPGGSRAAAPAASPSGSGAGVSKQASPVGSMLVDPAPAEAGLDTGGRDFFAEFRMDRERTRSALRESLERVMASESADGETRSRATQQYMDASRAASLEEQAESMVRARGFEDAVVHLGVASAFVVVKAGVLTQQQFAQVMDMVTRVAGVKATAVQVLARER